ncbi:hypothetical protein CYMTET_44253 [Cymbomonas tetramitiformis]|uniref:Uncharacterized protein n=1 Tax=Cymbomonas tetramitiformis TaxID=36881 RepID=A0AAE0C296_9CHLO|nr:hypothetical protein CYMTET_44253 [Cymbomonas tetramitiformis]
MYGDQASSEGDTNKTPPARERLVETREPKTGMEALLEQQAAMMTLMMQQMKDLNARVEVAEETAAKAASQAGSSAQSGDAELEQLKKLPYVPHVAGNLFPTRPPTLETDMPQMYGLYNDETYDALFKRTNSSMGYEQLVLAPALSYMHVAIASSEVALGWLQGEKEPPGVEDLGERVYTAHNTLKGVFALLINRYTMIQLRASMESDATTRGGAEALRAKPAFVEEKVYAGSDGLVTNSILTKWLKEFDTKKAKAVTNTPAKATAKASAKVSTFRDRQEEKAKTQRAVELERVKCGALPFGWYDSPRILVKAVKVLVEWLRSPRSSADRREVGKLQSESKLHEAGLVRGCKVVYYSLVTPGTRHNRAGLVRGCKVKVCWPTDDFVAGTVRREVGVRGCKGAVMVLSHCAWVRPEAGLPRLRDPPQYEQPTGPTG